MGDAKITKKFGADFKTARLHIEQISNNDVNKVSKQETEIINEKILAKIFGGNLQVS